MATNQFDYIVILNQSNTTSYLLFVGIYDQYLKVKKLFIIIFFSSKCKAYVIQYWYSINGKLWSLNRFQPGDRIYTSESDICRRQILSYKNGSHTERIKIL